MTGVHDRDRSAVRVHLLGVQLRPVAQARQRLRRERLVELDHRQVTPPDPGATERSVGGRNRPDAVQGRLDRAHAMTTSP